MNNMIYKDKGHKVILLGTKGWINSYNNTQERNRAY